MSLKRACPRDLVLGAICLILSIWHGNDHALAVERVSFESARYLVGPLQLRLARERGEAIERPPVDTIEGFLKKPDGNGPFPTVVLLHGCGGIPANMRSGARRHFWFDQLVAWGYAALGVDSFTTRGVTEACTGRQLPLSRVADAYGALAFLSRQPFVDTNRIAVMGFSQGATAALSAVEHQDFDLFEGQANWKFKTAIAFYPYCLHDGNFAVPTLILIGELDDWAPASACRTMIAKRKATESPVTLIVYPGAHHAFDVPYLQPGARVFGHWQEYNSIAASNATQEVRHFLTEKLRN
jgi:dienelactone hydrolase